MDVATLELRIDPSGLVTGSVRAEQALTSLGAKGDRTANAILTAFRGLAGFLVGGVLLRAFGAVERATTEATLAQARLEGVLRATGHSAGWTAERIEGLADELSRTTRFDDEAIKNAAARLATFGNITGEVFGRTIRLGTDLATLMGTDVSASVELLGKALQDPLRGIQQLTRANVALSAEERRAVQEAMRHGDIRRAQGAILDAVAAKVGGTGARGHSGLTGAMHDLRTEWGNFLETFGQTPGMANTVANAIALVADAIGGLILTIQPTRAMLEETLRQARDEETQRLARLQAQGPMVGETQEGFDRRTGEISREIADLTRRIDELRAASWNAELQAQRVAQNAARRTLTAVTTGEEGGKRISERHRQAMDQFNDLLAAQAQGLEEQRRAWQETANANVAATQKMIDAQRALVKELENLEEKFGRPAGAQGKPPTPPNEEGMPTGDFARAALSGDPFGALTQFALILPGISAAAQVAVPIFGQLIDSLFGGREAARRLDEAIRKMSQALEWNLRTVEAQIGGNTLEESIIGVEMVFARLREETQALYMARYERAGTSNRERLTQIWREYEEALGRLDELEKRRLEQVRQEAIRKEREATEDYEVRRLRATGLIAEAEANAFAQRQIREYEAAVRDGADATRLAVLAEALRAEATQRQATLERARARAMEDLDVRELRAKGLDDEADAMALMLSQQREYEDALLAGADAAQLARLQSVHFYEAQAAGIAKLEQRIAGLGQTIDSLRAFGRSLDVSESRSPVQRYAAARTQYEDVVRLAMTGDQAAAGRLPEVARQFLDISRSMFASGLVYQRDFEAVRKAVDAVASVFEGQRTDAQLQLDTLRNMDKGIEIIPEVIETQTGVLSAGFGSLTNELAFIRGELAGTATQTDAFPIGDALSVGFDTQTRVLSTGFESLNKGIEVVPKAIDTQTGVLSAGFESLADELVLTRAELTAMRADIKRTLASTSLN